MKRYKIRVIYSFEGSYDIMAENRDEARRIVKDKCKLNLVSTIQCSEENSDIVVSCNFPKQSSERII